MVAVVNSQETEQPSCRLRRGITRDRAGFIVPRQNPVKANLVSTAIKDCGAKTQLNELIKMPCR